MKSIYNLSLVIAMCLVIYSCNSPASGNPVADNKNPDRISITSQTFKTTDGWGYAVYVDNKLFIKQSVIPVVEGVKGFAKEADAEKVAALVINKLKQHQKPIIYLADLKQIGIVNK